MAREIDTTSPGEIEYAEELTSKGNCPSHSGPRKDIDVAPRTKFNPVHRTMEIMAE